LHERRNTAKIISENIGNDIYGIELDEKLFHECKEELDAIVKENKLHISPIRR